MGSDELIEAVKAAGDIKAEDDSASRLIARLQAMRADSINTQLDETDAHWASLPAAEPTRHLPAGEAPPSSELSFLDPPQAADELGRLGRFRVLEILGRGGMGVVLRAEDPTLRRDVAIKVLNLKSADKSDAKARFLRKAQATAAIDHDNIVTIHDVGEQRGMPYYAMQFLRGESLYDRLSREKRLPIAEAVRTAREIAQGLAAAHAKGLLHRDIKPANVWLEEGTGRVKIVDFGLARTGDDDSDLTHSGAVLGTPKYMSPEQAQGEAVDQRCDLFSLGSVLYYFVAGQPPFSGSNVTATLLAVASGRYEDVQSLVPDCPDGLKAIIDRLLKKSPDDRFATAGEVVAALQAVEDELSVAPSPISEVIPPAASASSGQGGYGKWIALAAAIPIFVLLGVIFLWRTPQGTLRVEVNDPQLEVLIDGDELTLTDKTWEGKKKVGKRRLKIKVGDQWLKIDPQTVFDIDGGRQKRRLSVRLNDVQLSGNEFEVVRDRETVLTITSVPVPAATANASGNGDRQAGTPPLAIAPFGVDEAKQHQQAWAEYLGLPVEKEVQLPGEAKMTFILIPPGEYEMGTSKADRQRLFEYAQEAGDEHVMATLAEEFPQHRVRITRPFYLASTETTQQQWEAVTGENPSRWKDDPQQPVDQISWDESREFAARLNAHLGAKGLTIRLPTEAQWEYACRAGTTTDWITGDHQVDVPAVAWVLDARGRMTHPVGTKKPNAWSLYDVHGNAHEWVADYFSLDYYEQSPTDDPTGPAEGSERVYRSGCQSNEVIRCRSATRNHAAPDHTTRYLGVRLAMSIDVANGALAGGQRFGGEQDIGSEFVDLLKLIDLDQDAMEGSWKLSGGELRTTQFLTAGHKQRASLRLPIIPNGDYELSATFKEATTNDDQNLYIFLPVGEYLCRLNIGRQYAGLFGFKGVELDVVNEPGFPLVPNRAYNLVAVVKTEGETASIKVNLDRRPFLSYNGTIEKLTPWAGERESGHRTINIQTINELHEFTKLELRMLSGQAKRLRSEDARSLGMHRRGHFDGLRFDGETASVRVPTLKYDGSHPLTIEAIVTPQAQDSSAVLASLNYGGYRLRIEGGRWMAGFEVPYERKQSAKDDLTPNKRTHLALVYSGDAVMFFVDGRLQARDEVEGKYKPPRNDADLFLGADAHNQTNQATGHFLGDIHQVRFSKAALYEKNFAVPEKLEKRDDTLALFRLDEGAGDIAHDSSGNGHHGVIDRARWIRIDGEPDVLKPPDVSKSSNFIPGEWVDLLPSVDVDQDTLQGTWQKSKDQVLTTEITKSRSLIQVVEQAPQSYEFETEFRYTDFDAWAEIRLHLPVADGRVTIVKAIESQFTEDGIQNIQSVYRTQTIAAPETDRQLGAQQQGQWHRLGVKVTTLNDQFAIEASLDEQAFARWKGPITAVVADDASKTTDARAIVLRGYAHAGDHDLPGKMMLDIRNARIRPLQPPHDQARVEPLMIPTGGLVEGEFLAPDGDVPNRWRCEGVFAEIHGQGILKYPRMRVDQFALDVELEIRDPRSDIMLTHDAPHDRWRSEVRLAHTDPEADGKSIRILPIRAVAAGSSSCRGIRLAR